MPRKGQQRGHSLQYSWPHQKWGLKIGNCDRDRSGRLQTCIPAVALGQSIDTCRSGLTLLSYWRLSPGGDHPNETGFAISSAQRLPACAPEHHQFRLGLRRQRSVDRLRVRRVFRRRKPDGSQTQLDPELLRRGKIAGKTSDFGSLLTVRSASVTAADWLSRSSLLRREFAFSESELLSRWCRSSKSYGVNSSTSRPELDTRILATQLLSQWIVYASCFSKNRSVSFKI